MTISSERYAEVAVDIPNADTFQYLVPAELAREVIPGALVRVPFGKSTRIGMVVERTAEQKVKRHKEVLARVLPDFVLPPDLLRLARWMSGYYMCGLGRTLCAISSVGFRALKPKTERRFGLSDRAAASQLLAAGDEQLKELRLTPKQQAVVALLLESDRPALAEPIIKQEAGAGISVISKLVDRGILAVTHEPVIQADYYPQADELEQPLTLTPAQADAFAEIRRELEAGKFSSHLLHGITSSGKTEVYLHAIAEVLERDGQAIVLVPEIALTPQTVERFRKRFGRRVGVSHSRLSRAQKYSLYRQIRSGDISIVVGARSAVFAPFERLALIVIDEEHETSYKQDTLPRYHARDVALMRARECSASVIMGSATPSLEAYDNARVGKFRLHSLPERLGAAALPEVKLIDMSREVEVNQNVGLFSLELADQIRQRLAAGEQTILFLNRRGFNPIVLCRECSQMIGCKQCDMLLTYHKARHRLVCHLCGDWQAVPERCPECDSPSLHRIGLGTERIEEEVAAEFPNARLTRVDLDTTSSRHAFLDKWREIQAGEVDIILGTQMIAKGLDLPLVTLVGVVLADVSLFQPDFRAAERSFSILTQVAGRAGRRDTPGQVLIQTYCPYHYAIQFAKEHDYVGFFTKEMTVRRILRFPPHYRLTGLIVTGRQAEQTRKMALVLSAIIRRVIDAGVDDEHLSLVGPAPAPIAVIKGNSRWRMLLRGSLPSAMHGVIRRGIAEFVRLNPKSGVGLAIDVDPLDLM
ncbi:primosomal protein N' [Candidatus Sumerlaeota bacterium]